MNAIFNFRFQNKSKRQQSTTPNNDKSKTRNFIPQKKEKTERKNIRKLSSRENQSVIVVSFCFCVNTTGFLITYKHNDIKDIYKNTKSKIDEVSANRHSYIRSNKRREKNNIKNQIVSANYHFIHHMDEKSMTK